MDIENLTDWLKFISVLPTEWKIFYALLFFAIPKIIQILGGPQVIHSAFSKMGLFLSRVVLRYQARKARQAEDRGLTDAYTRTLVVESLGLFLERIGKMDHKIDYVILLLIGPETNIEEIEKASDPKEKVTETEPYHKLHQRLEEMRKDNEAD